MVIYGFWSKSHTPHALDVPVLLNPNMAAAPSRSRRPTELGSHPSKLGGAKNLFWWLCDLEASSGFETISGTPVYRFGTHDRRHLAPVRVLRIDQRRLQPCEGG